MNPEHLASNDNFSGDILALIHHNKTIGSSISAELDDLSSWRDTVIIACYSIVVVVSIFGNSLVCNIVVRKASMRRTTYVLIANLALSDLLMTVLNIPFNVARVLLNDWPFGGFMCSVVPLVQATSVYVSTFTMMLIALDRYRAICKPFLPRLGSKQALMAIVLVWTVAIFLSLPHAVFNKIETVFSVRPMVRCRSLYPEDWGRWITLCTFITQYFLPLSVTGLVYVAIVARVWSRDVLGVVTEAQLLKQAKAKRKTIKMLVLVVVLFAICWLPLNTLHLLKEFTSLRIGKSSTWYFVCHWLAMSSVCYNPFIYCCLNKNFRNGAIACSACFRNFGRSIQSSFGSAREANLVDLPLDSSNFSFDSRSDVAVAKNGLDARRGSSMDRCSNCGSIGNRSGESVAMVSFQLGKKSKSTLQTEV